ncbi:hypothetical protein [Nocardia sp. NBC_00511]|uniref:hypothetical protein n=1 Tax=Nocardia sp. NBC_00511 TaxID=2903591 RepID=UPI0030E57508
MKKSIAVVAFAALPLLAACSNSQQAASPTSSTAPAAVTSATTVSGTPTATPGATPSSGASVGPGASTTATSGGLSVDQVSKALQDKGKLSQQNADCVAGIYVQEGLSQSGIQKIIDSANGADPGKLSLSTEDLIKAGKATKRIATECVK